jgi:hypothetical protein
MRTRIGSALLVSALGVAVGLGMATPRATRAATATQEYFPSAEAAVAALVAALKPVDTAKLLAVLGPEAKPLVSSGDAVADREAAEHFMARYEEANRIETGADGHATLEIGKEAWPFPIPLVKDAKGWRFDTAAGAEEILDRRIGRNELSAIQSCLAVVDAQNEYYTSDPNHDGLLHYARHIVSTKGKRDGLYWPAAAGEPESPLGPAFAAARAAGYGKSTSGGQTPYHGYYFRLLDGQGPHAKGGAYSYLAHGQMLGGFALVAWPATWGNSGVMTFLVNQDGVVYQKDLGPETAKTAEALKLFDPDDTWQRVPEADEAAEEAPGAGQTAAP